MASTQLEPPEQLSAADRAYSGSRYSEVVEALFANPYQRVWGGQGEPPLPVCEVTFRSVVGGILPFVRPELFRQATRTRRSIPAPTCAGAPIAKDFAACVHPNGVCLIGRWRIVEDTGYSGYFSQGQHGARDRPVLDLLHRDAPWAHAVAVDGRQALSDDRSEPRRSRFARPTSSRRRTSAAPRTEFINDAELRNAPDTTVSRRGAGAPPCW